MKDEGNIHFTLSVEGIDRYCRELARHTSTVERRVTALDALKTFVTTVTDPGEQSKPVFADIKETLEHHFELARYELQDEHSRSIVEALRERQLTRIVPIFNSLSRGGFRQLLVRAENILGKEASRNITEWCTEWLARAKERSEKVSTYPDTIDFNAAGIDVTEYMVMSELCTFFA